MKRGNLMIKHLARKSIATFLAALIAAPAPLTCAVAPAAAETVTLDNLEVGPDQVTIRLSGDAKYESFVTASPPRVVLQFHNTEYQAGARSLKGKGTYLKAVRSGQFQRTPDMIARVVLDLKDSAEFTVSKIDSGVTVVLGASAPATQAAEQAQAAPDSGAKLKNKPVSDPAEASAELAGAPSQYSPELENIAEKSDADLGTRDAIAAVPAPAVRARAVRAHGDILNRLPRDLVSLEFDNTDIRDVLKFLATKAKVNIIYGDDVSGNLTLHLTDVPFNEAFRTILTMLNLSSSQVGDSILRVLTPAALAKANNAAATATRVIPLNYAKASEMLAAINSVRTAEGRSGLTVADIKSNSVIVTESPEGMAVTERLIAQLDVRPKQVLIEVKLVEVGLTNSLHYGIQWDYLGVDGAKMGGKQGTNIIGTVQNPTSSGMIKPLDNNPAAAIGLGAGARGTGVSLPATAVFGALTLGRITNNYFLSATLTAAAAEGKVKILSDPKVATLNNQAANINVTTSIPYVTSNVASTGVQTQTVSWAVTGIQLTVTPTITADGRITLLINPNVSQPSAVNAASVTGAPAIDSRNATTTVLVKDGETIVIGGLISDSVTNQIAKIPLLGDIPILGWLFKKKSLVRSRAELLIFVTPKIMPD